MTDLPIHMPCGCPYPKIGDHRPCVHGNGDLDVTDAAITAAAEALKRYFHGLPYPEAAAKRALEAAAPHIRDQATLAAGACPTLCDPDCEQICHEVHDIPTHRDHDPEQCRATQLAQAVAAERQRWTRIEPDPDQPGYNRGVFDVTSFVAETYAEQIAAAAAAERQRLKAEMPTVVIQVADGGVIGAAEWNVLGDRLKAAWHEHIDAAVAAERQRIRQAIIAESVTDDSDDAYGEGWVMGRVHERRRTLGLLGPQPAGADTEPGHNAP